MIRHVLLCAAGLGLASLLGSAIGAIVRKIPHRWNDIFLGFCAGMMLAAALVCLIMPSIEMLPISQSWQSLLGIALGVGLISVLDYVTPHLHRLSGLNTEHHPSGGITDKVLLFVLAIALHKFPEGLATGVSFDGGDIANAYTLSVVIALQNIPEGMVVVTPLIMVGVGMWRVVIVSLTVALLEVVGVCVGYWLGDLSTVLLPGLMGMAGGAMLYVICDEIMPETQSHGYEKQATYAIVAGVMAMLLIEKIA